MGLDTVELVMAIEDEFGIHIDNTEATECTTPNIVADYVLSRVRTSSSDPCLSQKGFYKIRKAIANTFGIAKRDISPNTNLSVVLDSQVKRNWELLRVVIGTDDFPKLKRSRNFCIFIVFGIPLILTLLFVSSGWSIPMLCLMFFVLVVLLEISTNGMGREIPTKFSTVGSLIPFVECSSNKVWSRDEILSRVVELTSEQLGIPISEITPGSQFVHDLGAD
jgi:acyl carrier protein